MAILIRVVRFIYTADVYKYEPCIYIWQFCKRGVVKIGELVGVVLHGQFCILSHHNLIKTDTYISCLTPTSHSYSW